MNREEAKAILEEVKELDDSIFQYNKVYMVALDMAITALSQEQQSEWERDHEVLKAYADGQESMKPCEDAISRQAALDLCERFDGCVPYSVLSNYDMLPSVSTEKTGRWRECEDNTSFVRQIPRRWLECSNCGWSCDLGYKSRYKYCPNCGAKMEVEE